MKSIADIIPAGSVIPVCTINNPNRAAPLARTLQDCGIHCIEITLRTADALEAAENVLSECPDMCVGLGTVTATEQLRRAKHIGVQFCVSPGATAALAHSAKQLTLPYLPGVSSVSEVMVAREWRLRHLKFFPAELSGGVRTLSIFRELFPDTRFCPTGGINAANAGAYLSLDNVFCIGGSWLAPTAQIEAADWQGIKQTIQGWSAGASSPERGD